MGCLFVGQLTIRPLLSLTLSDWFFATSLVLVMLRMLVNRSFLKIALPKMMIIGVSLYIFGGLVSAIYTSEFLLSLSVLTKLFFSTLIVISLALIVIRNRSQLIIAISCWSISAAVNGVAAFAQLVIDPNIVPGTIGEWGRMTGFTAHSNDLGAIASIAVIPAAVISSQFRGRTVSRVVSMVVVILIVAAVLLSGSLASIVVSMCAFLVWTYRDWRRAKPLALILTLIVLSLGVVYVPENYGLLTISSKIERVFRATGHVSTFDSRVNAYNDAFKEIDDNPLIGRGPLPGGRMTSTGDVVHNALIAAWYESGIFGAIGFSMIWVFLLLIALSRVRDESGNRSDDLVNSLSAAVVAFIAYSMTGPVLYQRYGWIAVALLLAAKFIMEGSRNQIDRVIQPNQMLIKDNEVENPCGF